MKKTNEVDGQRFVWFIAAYIKLSGIIQFLVPLHDTELSHVLVF